MSNVLTAKGYDAAGDRAARTRPTDQRASAELVPGGARSPIGILVARDSASRHSAA